MEKQPRFWWQQIKQHRAAIRAVAIVLAIVIALIIISYYNGTGFNGYNQVTTARTISGPSTGTVIRTEVYQPGKSLWDWLQLLIIPAVLAVGGYLFNYTTTRNERAATEQRSQTERDIAQDNQRETALQQYIDKMSELLLEKKLRDSTEEDEVQKIARVRTLTVLRRIDVERIGRVLKFLYEARLINTSNPIIDLSSADLAFVNLRRALLNEVNLAGADLTGAGFSGADLSKADLSSTHLQGANLTGAKLEGANLQGARYNTKAIQLEDVHLTLEPTQWPQGFDPKDAGSICVDDTPSYDA